MILTCWEDHSDWSEESWEEKREELRRTMERQL